jgi:hypothetical protein
MKSKTKMSKQYTDQERVSIETNKTCLICGGKNKKCKWFVNHDNGCETFCCAQCIKEKDDDDTGYWGMRGCCNCGEENRESLIMGSCVCEKYFNLCRECATENDEGEWCCHSCK